MSAKMDANGILCVCVLPGSFRGMGAFYFKIEETLLLFLFWHRR